jgi:RNA polymerase primary sigma factor
VVVHVLEEEAVGCAVVDEGRTIRLPVHVGDKARKVRGYYLTHLAEHNREPSLRDAAAALGLSATQVELVLTAPVEPASLDAPAPWHNPASGTRPISLRDVVDDPSPTPKELTLANLVAQARRDALERAVWLGCPISPARASASSGSAPRTP